MFNFNNFIINLPYLLKGMVGLFVALGVIALATIALNKLSEKNLTKFCNVNLTVIISFPYAVWV